MKNSTIALLAVAGIGGYFILKQTQQTAAAIQGVAEIPLIPFKAAGQVFQGVEQQVVANQEFVGQAAAQILSNANQVIQIPQKQIEQTANNLLTALPAAVNALNVLNPLTLPLTTAAVTSNAIMNAFTKTSTPAPTAPMVSSGTSSNYVSPALAKTFAAEVKATPIIVSGKVTGYETATQSIPIYSSAGQAIVAKTIGTALINPTKAATASPFSTTTTKATSTATTSNAKPSSVKYITDGLGRTVINQAYRS